MDKQGFTNVDEYLAYQPEHLRDKLDFLRQTILSTIPDAEEIISYQMPAYRYHGMIAYFGVATHHYALYISPQLLDEFRDRLAAYRMTKSAIHFPHDERIPVELVKEIILHAFRKNVEKAELKKRVKSKKNNN